MIKKTLFFLLFLGSIARLHAQDNRLGILYSRISTLAFEEDIVDIEIGNQEYHVKVKGRCILLRAKHKQAQPTSIFVRYGKKMRYYVAEIFPNDNVPLTYNIAEDIGKQEVKTKEEKLPTFTKDNQKYFTLGVIKNGIRVILTNIYHVNNTTNVQLYIDNASSIDLCLSHWTFEYVTTLRKFLFFKKKKVKLAEPVYFPDSIKVPAFSGDYVVFAIPTYVSEGRLEIFLGEDYGEREFRFVIPNKVLLKAQRRETPHHHDHFK